MFKEKKGIINFTEKHLVGSSVFFSGDSFISRIVKFGGLFSKTGGYFKPFQMTHVGTIVMQENGKLGLLEALQPKVVINDLEERVKNCKDKMYLARLKNNNIQKIKDNEMLFNELVEYFEGRKYNTLNSALAGIDIFPDGSYVSKQLNKLKKNTLHCSFLDGKMKQECGIIDEDENCKEFAPDDLWKMPIYDKFQRLK